MIKEERQDSLGLKETLDRMAKSKKELKEKIVNLNIGWVYWKDDIFELGGIHENIIRQMIGYYPARLLNNFLRDILDELVDEGVLGYVALITDAEGGYEDRLDLRTINCSNLPRDDRFYFNFNQVIDSINTMEKDLIVFKKAIGD